MSAALPLRDLPDDYDLDHLRGALEHVKCFRTAVDGGAHRGIWTRELVTRFRSVVAFEPRGPLARQIEVGTVYQFALGHYPGMCSIAEGEKNNGQGHVVLGNDVRMMPLDHFGIVNLDFLKLDLEGYELPALKGALRTIEAWKPAIMVEQNGLSARYGYTSADLNNWLVERDYVRVASWGVDVLYKPKHEHRSRL